MREPLFFKNRLYPLFYKRYSPKICTCQKNTYRFAQLSKENGIIPQLLAANPLHLTLAASTEEVEADTVLLRFDEFTETRSQFSILSVCQATLKHTILHPLPIRLQDTVDFRAALIFRDVIRHNYVHNYFTTKGGYFSISPIKYFASNRA